MTLVIAVAAWLSLLLAIVGLCVAARRGDTCARVLDESRRGELAALDGVEQRLGRRAELEPAGHGTRRGAVRGDARLGSTRRAAA